MRSVLPVTTLLTLSSLCSLTALSSGCGPGAAAEAIRPNDPTAASALGEQAECHEVGKTGEPLVVDWKPEQRGDLEEAMREGVAVVNYSCQGIKLLKECDLKGLKDAKEPENLFRFMGMTRREQVVQLQNADELKANLPFSGGAVGGELARGSSLDIAMVSVGKTKTTKTPTMADLEGECEGATHYVRGATVGAFAVDTGTSAKVRAAVEIFGASAGGGSESKKSVGTKEGDLSDCAKASPSSKEPPPQCGAPIRLVLQAIAKDAPKPPAEGAAPAAAAEIEAPEATCPKGLVFSGGKCTAAASAPSYQCDPQNVEECKAQCDKGNAGSCSALGAKLAAGGDHAKAAEALKKACDGGDAPGCVRLGKLTADGQGVSKDAAAAATFFEKGCNNGEEAGCGLLGRAYLAGNGVSADPSKAAQLLERSCNGGYAPGCAGAAPLYAEGKGVPADLPKAAQLYKSACYGGDAPSCGAAGMMYESGRGIGKNTIIAGMLYQSGCIRAHGDSCLGQGRMELSKPGGGNADMARRAFEQACIWRSSLGCAVLKAAYGQNRPVIPDVAQQQAMRKSCDGGNATDCANVGLLAVASGNKVGGKMDLDRACTRGEAFACFVAKQVK